MKKEKLPMIVDFEGKRFYVKFYYINSDNHRILTHCQIICDDGEKRFILNTGTSYKHPNDNFVKDYGRKIALRRALELNENLKKQFLFANDEQYLLFRKTVWKRYFEFTNKPYLYKEKKKK